MQNISKAILNVAAGIRPVPPRVAVCLLVLLCLVATSQSKAANHPSLQQALIVSLGQYHIDIDHLAHAPATFDSNDGVHNKVRKPIKLKLLKKFTPHASLQPRLEYVTQTPTLSIIGFGTITRPAYYLFLFRYTLF